MYICASEVETPAKSMMKDGSYETKTYLDKRKLQGTFVNPLKCIYWHDMVMLEGENKL